MPFGEQRIGLPLPHEVGGYGRILRGFWNLGESLDAADGLAGREIGKCSLARERYDRRRIAGAVVAFADVKRIIVLIMSELGRLESSWSASVAGRAALDADYVRYEKLTFVVMRSSSD